MSMEQSSYVSRHQQTAAAWPGLEIPIPTMKSWEQWSSQPEQEDPGCSIPGQLVGLAR